MNTQYFLLRRLHSLLGVFPLGIFLFNHLLTNSTAIVSAQFFEEKVYLLHLLGPLLPIVEAVVIFIPLSIHIALGIYIALQSKNEIGSSMPYWRNYAYVFQRWSGWVALVFILYHVIHLRFLHDMAAEPFSVVLGRMFAESPFAPVILLAYLVGGLAVIFHFANGLCTFCMSWGITIGPNSQRYMAYAASGVAAVLLAMLMTSLVAFRNIGVDMRNMNEEDRAAFVLSLRAVHDHSLRAPSENVADLVR